MNRIVPGRMDLNAMRALADMAGPRDPAQAHRPADPASLAREARSLLGLGLSVVDAAQSLGLSPRALADLLNDSINPEEIQQ